MGCYVKNDIQLELITDIDCFNSSKRDHVVAFHILQIDMGKQTTNT